MYVSLIHFIHLTKVRSNLRAISSNVRKPSMTLINLRYPNMFHRNQYRVVVYKKSCSKLPYQDFDNHGPSYFPSSTFIWIRWFFFFILLHINFCLKDRNARKHLMQTSRLSVIAQVHLYLKVRWPHFVMLTPSKSRCCTPRENEFAVFVNSFLGHQYELWRIPRHELLG